MIYRFDGTLDFTDLFAGLGGSARGLIEAGLIGNAVSVNASRWLGERVKAVLA